MRWIVPLGGFRPADKSWILIPWEFCPTLSRIRETRSIVWTRLFGLDGGVFRSIGFLSCSIKDEPRSPDRVDDNAPWGRGKDIIPYCGMDFLITKLFPYVTLFFVLK